MRQPSTLRSTGPVRVVRPGVRSGASHDGPRLKGVDPRLLTGGDIEAAGASNMLVVYRISAIHSGEGGDSPVA
jgi:hypothetical protein